MNEKKKITVDKLLEKYKLNSKKINDIKYHLNISWCEAETLVKKVSGLTKLKEEELAKILFDLILKCDAESTEYDVRVYEEMMRIGNKTEQSYGGRPHSKWTGDHFEDGAFGFGTSVTSIYDDFQDSDYAAKLK